MNTFRIYYVFLASLIFLFQRVGGDDSVLDKGRLNKDLEIFTTHAKIVLKVDATSPPRSMMVLRTFLKNIGSTNKTVLRGNLDRIYVANNVNSYVYSFYPEMDRDFGLITPSTQDFAPVDLQPGQIVHLADLAFQIDESQVARSVLVKYVVNSTLSQFISCWSGELSVHAKLY